MTEATRESNMTPGKISIVTDDEDNTSEMIMEHMLTTTDNPFDPFTQWEEWFAWDLRKGYNTPGLLARLVTTSDALSDADQRLEVEVAIDAIVRQNLFGVHRKVSRELRE